MNKNNEEDENRLIAERRAKLLTIRENKKVAFPNNFKPNTNASELQEKFIRTSKSELEAMSDLYALGGRLTRNRGAFLVLQDSTGVIQLYVNKNARKFAKSLDLGDIIGVRGRLYLSLIHI